MNFSLYWKIFDYRDINKTVDNERRNASFTVVTANILFAFLFSTLASFLILKSLFETIFASVPEYSASLSQSYSPGPLVLTVIINFIGYIVLYASLHYVSRFLGGDKKSTLTELAYFMSALLPLTAIVVMLLTSLLIVIFMNPAGILLAGGLQILVFIYLVYITLKIVKSFNPSFSFLRALAVLVLSGILYFVAAATLGGLRFLLFGI